MTPKTKGTSSSITVAHFDGIANRYRGRYDEKTPVGYLFSVRKRRVLDLFDRPGGKVLDVGCGPGVMVEALAAQGCAFWGVDPSARMVEEASAAFVSIPATQFTVGFAERLEHPEDSFDAVLCMGVLERVADDVQALKEMIRVLKPGGTLILTVPNKASPALWWRDHVFYPMVELLRPLHDRLTGRSTGEPVRGHRLYDRPSLAAALETYGCVVTDAEYCVYNVALAPFDEVFPNLTTALMRRFEMLSRTRLRALGGMLVVKATKQ